MEICLDANVFINMTVGNTSSDVCTHLLSYVLGRDGWLYEPTLVACEVPSVLHKKCQAGAINPDEMREGIEAFFALPMIMQWQLSMQLKAQELATAVRFSNTYDTQYLAVAIERHVPLITEDQELIKKGRPLYKHIYTPREYLTQYC